MPATAPLIEADLLAELKTNDENALERLFRERFAPLLDRATGTLGEPARAARAVERAFLDLWDGRAQFETPEALEQYLDAAFRDAVSVQRSRAASLRRFEAMEAVHAKAPAAVPDVDSSWDRIAAALSPNGPRETLESVRAESRHHTAEHLAALGRRRTRPLAVGGVVALAAAVIALLFWLPRRGADGTIDRALSSRDARQVSTEDGQRGSIRLGDGTAVTMGAHSTLTIADGFGTRLRAVALAGTASFEPTVNREMPFVVRVRDVQIRATGTVFDVAAFPGDRAVTVRVRAGTVEVMTDEEVRAVAAGTAAVITDDGAIADASPTAVAEALGWVDGEIVIAGRTLGYAVPVLRRWFGLTLTVNEKALLDRPLTMRAGVDSMRAAIRELQNGAQVFVDYDGKKNVVWDAARRAR
ncbi:MAG TPA: FecR family protein [Gemmatimonadaceae bacterium]|nr:FecR family protein [Gemmatimonadaceae bacterium]